KHFRLVHDTAPFVPFPSYNPEVEEGPVQRPATPTDPDSLLQSYLEMTIALRASIRHTEVPAGRRVTLGWGATFHDNECRRIAWRRLSEAGHLIALAVMTQRHIVSGFLLRRRSSTSPACTSGRH